MVSMHRNREATLESQQPTTANRETETAVSKRNLQTAYMRARQRPLQSTNYDQLLGAAAVAHRGCRAKQLKLASRAARTEEQFELPILETNGTAQRVTHP